MPDKKKKLEISEQKKEVRELKEIELTTETKDQVFPTRVQGRNRILAGVIDNVEVCYLCMDTMPGIVILHLYLPVEHRNTEIITKMVEMFYSHVHPWCKEQGYSQILVNCPGEDIKTTAMFKTFGFEPVNINLAIMPIN